MARAAKPRHEPLDDEDILAILRAYKQDAENYADDTLAPDRERAFTYYEGLVLNDDNTPEQRDPGRSATVVREVADIVHTMLPGIIRIFAGGDRVVDYEPRSQEDEPAAMQATEYVSWLLNADGNNWFSTLYDSVHDALLKKIGVIKWWFEESTSVEEFDYTGLTLLQFMQLSRDPEITVLEQSTQAPAGGALDDAAGAGDTEDQTEPPDPGVGAASVPAPPPGVGPPPDNAPPGGGLPPLAAAPPPGAVPGLPPLNGAGPGMPPPVSSGGMPGLPGMFDPGPQPAIDCTVRRERIKRLLRVQAVPPEEFLIAREARTVLLSRYTAHRTTPTVSELLELGYDRETVEAHAKPDAGGRNTVRSNEARQRNPGLREGDSDGGPDISTWRVPYTEAWVRIDADGDGIAELHRICTVGENDEEIVADEIDYDAPFALLNAIRLPHAAIGYSIADQTIDLQDIKTSVLRSILDSLAQSIFPRTAVVENAVTMDDVLNNEVGAIIRMQAPGMVQALSEPFIGQQALGVMNYLDEMRAQRTGISRQSQGLDANVLQSTTKSAVSASVEATQDRVELIARTFAEIGIKDVFKGLLRHIIRHQDKPRVVRLRNQWVSVDPRFWDAEMDVSVNVGLGRGTDEQRMAFLQTIGQKQEQVLQMLGPDNALVSIGQLRETYAEMLRIAGFKNPDRFFKVVTPMQEQQLSQQMAQNKPPDPNQLLAQVEGEKTKAKFQTDQSQQQLDAAKTKSDDDFRRDQLDADVLLRAAEIQAKYGTQVDIQTIQAALERDRQALTQSHELQLSREQQIAAAVQQRADQAHQMAQQGATLGANRDLATQRANTQIRTGLIREALRAPPIGAGVNGAPPGNGAAAPDGGP
jgi:hypothetical protein